MCWKRSEDQWKRRTWRIKINEKGYEKENRNTTPKQKKVRIIILCIQKAHPRSKDQYVTRKKSTNEKGIWSLFCKKNIHAARIIKCREREYPEHHLKSLYMSLESVCAEKEKNRQRTHMLAKVFRGGWGKLYGFPIFSNTIESYD